MKTKHRSASRKEISWYPAEGSRPARRNPSMADTTKAPGPGSRLPLGRGSVEYGLGSEGDHEAVYQTLLHVFHGPDRDSFLGALSDPAYKPDQRMIARIDNRVVSHVHFTKRTIRYGGATLPMNGVMWVGTLPE